MRRRMVLGGLVSLAAAPVLAETPPRRGRRLYADNFRHGLDQWALEAEKPAQVSVHDCVLDIDTPAGLTLWFRPELAGPVLIEYEAQAVSAGGPHDRVSDLNAFWMARDASGESPLAHPRSGAFADYDTLKTYYVGQGGNGNTSTRFRRYVGRPGDRPLLPQHDHAARDEMLVPNRWQTVRLIADGGRIQYWNDGRKLFQLDDAEPYTRGWFGLRTTWSHLRVRRFRVYALTR
ncbi:MAG: Tat pathway signal sequence domain protein [Caulobacter sp.]|nr:Tat pathway signal sequence domain protein [Caulobacter sp.]